MILDVAVLSILLVSCVFAFFRGFIREALTILGVGGGAVASFYGGPVLLPLMRGWLGVREGAETKLLFGHIPYSVLAMVLSYGGIFLVVVISLSIVSHFLSKGAKALGLGALDRSAGVLFGIARAALVVGALYLPLYMMTDKPDRDSWGWMQGSHLRGYVEADAGWMDGFLPGSLASRAGNGAQKSETAVAHNKLCGLGLLDCDDKQDAPAGQQQSAVAPAAGPGAGYDAGQRQDMKDLIGKGLNQ